MFPSASRETCCVLVASSSVLMVALNEQRNRTHQNNQKVFSVNRHGPKKRKPQILSKNELVQNSTFPIVAVNY